MTNAPNPPEPDTPVPDDTVDDDRFAALADLYESENDDE